MLNDLDLLNDDDSGYQDWQPSGVGRLTFGKHKGKTIAEIEAEEPDYLYWLMRECTSLSQPLREEAYRRCRELNKERLADAKAMENHQ